MLGRKGRRRPGTETDTTWGPDVARLPLPPPAPAARSRRRPGGPPVIEVRQPGRSVLRIEIQNRLDIGRECDGLLVTDERVSRRHLRLEVSEGRLVAIDLGSSNGTWLDGRRLTGPEVLGPDDQLRLGSISIRVSDGADGPP